MAQEKRPRCAQFAASSGPPGTIELEGERIDGLRSDQIVAAGVTMVPEGRQLFPYISVRDNLLMGAYKKSARATWHQRMDEVLEIFPRVREPRPVRGQSLGAVSSKWLRSHVV